MTITRPNLAILTFVAAFLAGFVAPSTAEANLDVATVVACCDSVDSPSSCSPVSAPSDLSSCDPAAELGLCTLEDGVTTTCKPVELSCCQESAGVIWADACSQQVPPMICLGVVVGTSE